eukprot:25177_1
MESSDSANDTMDYAKIPKYAKYEKMKKIGVDNIRIANKMLDAGFTESEIVRYFGYAPPIFKRKKRYDVEQEQKLKKLKLFIEDQTKISTVRIIEGFLRNIQKANNYNDLNMILFQIVPTGITHLCYKYCTQFKYYLVLLYCRKNYDDYMRSELKILGINDIERTNKDLSKQIKHIVSKKSNSDPIAGYREYSNALLYIPQLTLSSQVVHKKLSIDNIDIPISAIFRSTLNSNYKNLDMLYFYSPYFYDYKLDIENKKKLIYYQYKLPDTTYLPNYSSINDAIHVPFSNHMLTFGMNNTNKRNVIGIMDLNNLQWLTNKKNYNWVKLNNDMIFNQSLCLYKNKLFLIGGSVVNRGNKALNDMETLNCSKIVDLFKLSICDQIYISNECRVKAVPLASKMNVGRISGSCDIMEVKNSMIVIGGGYQNNAVDDASNSMEYYDHYKDKWMLHGAKTNFSHQYSKLWCSGNLVFITGGLLSVANNIGDIVKIECIDIRENSNKWLVLDQRDVQKLFNLFNTQNSYQKQGLFI